MVFASPISIRCKWKCTNQVQDLYGIYAACVIGMALCDAPSPSVHLSYALPATSVVALVVVCLLVPCKPRRQGYGLVLLVIVEDDLVLLHKHWLVLAVPQVRHDLELDVRVR